MAPILKTERLTKYFGALCAVHTLDIAIQPGEITGLVGPNGAGKTTVFNLITGFLKPNQGHVFFKGKDVTGYKPHQLCRMGISRTFQLSSNFPNFTVMENVLLGGHRRCKITPQMFVNWPSKREVEEAMETLRLLGLENFANEMVVNLPSGPQRSLQLAIALMSRPELLLLDEPTSGMTLAEIDFILQIIRNIQTSGVTVFLIEHNMRVVMEICKHIIVIDFGSKVAEGMPEYIQNHPKVIEIYLGVEEEEHVT